MSPTILMYKSDFLKKEKKKIMRINKYFLYQYKSWSLKKIEKHNQSKTISSKELPKCIISEKKKSICYSTNINSHSFKKLIYNGELPNLKRAVW